MPPFRLMIQIDSEHQFAQFREMLNAGRLKDNVAIFIGKSCLSLPTAIPDLRKLEMDLPIRPQVFVYLEERADLALSSGIHGTYFSENTIMSSDLHPFFRQNLSLAQVLPTLKSFLPNPASPLDLVVLQEPMVPDAHETQFNEFKQFCKSCRFPVFANTPSNGIKSMVEAGTFGIVADASLWNSESPLQTLHQLQHEILRCRIK